VFSFALNLSRLSTSIPSIFLTGASVNGKVKGNPLNVAEALGLIERERNSVKKGRGAGLRMMVHAHKAPPWDQSRVETKAPRPERRCNPRNVHPLALGMAEVVAASASRGMLRSVLHRKQNEKKRTSAGRSLGSKCLT
jgi:hypothetical protein